MKKILFITLTGAMALASCVQFDFDGARETAIKENAEEVFGLIDPKQDWSNITSGTVTLTADASLKDITKVQILSESPYFNDNAKILAEADVTKGQTVTLNYDAPRGTTRLIAACVDSKGNFFIKGFNVDESKVSFNKSSQARTRGITRGADDIPDLSGLSMQFSNSEPSFNAARTALASSNSSFSQWKDSNWENDRLWAVGGGISSSSWSVNNGTIYRNADPITEEEKQELLDIFNSTLQRVVVNNKRIDNLKNINESSAVQFFNNHLVSDGKAPITIIPVQLASTEAYLCDIYYYYYKLEDIPAGISETEYIKSLPKFKVADMGDERSAFSSITGVATTDNDLNIQKVHEYLLPFYGDPSEFMLKEKSISYLGYKTDGKFYRIRCSDNTYMTYTTNADNNLKAKYENDAENIADQVWQIFFNENGYVMFYNVGSQQFLNYDYKNYSDGKLYPGFLAFDKNLDFGRFCFAVCDKNNKIYDKNNIPISEVVHLMDYDRNVVLKSDASKRIARDISNKKDRATIQWTFEPYEPTKDLAKVNDDDFKVDVLPTTLPTPTAIIGEGYRIGIMLRKAVNDNVNADKNGCLYSYGELNKEINTYGNFRNAMDNYSMKENDPRIAMFSANDKTYLTFEDGADCNFNDIIIEIGGSSVSKIVANSTSDTGSAPSYTTEAVYDEASTQEQVKLSGIYMFDTIEEAPNSFEPFTMCFEDRPIEADYDMNDVVLRCIRDRENKALVHLSIIAVGAYDRVYIRGIEGELVSGTNLMDNEVHALFGKEFAENDDRYINTKPDLETTHNYITGCYRIGENVSIPQFLTKIYIKNETMIGEVGVPKTGEPPYALIIPGDFNYPRERTSIINAYENFKGWATNIFQYNNWLNNPVDDKVYTNPASRSK